MREIIAVCRSTKKSRERAARILDQYFWRIGGRTWRGKASNACLDRVARELRRDAARNMAVTIHEIRSAHSSRVPLIRIGSKQAFSHEGLVPVASHPAEFPKMAYRSDFENCALAIVSIAILFHDLGKATTLFQAKLRAALKGAAIQADAVRHELHSAVVFDLLFGRCEDGDLQEALLRLTPDGIDAACTAATRILVSCHQKSEEALPLAFLDRKGSLSQAIGLLILTHHRLPEGDTGGRAFLPLRHVNTGAALQDVDLCIAPGKPFWHESWWLKHLQRNALLLKDGVPVGAVDMALRASVMFADHLGSAQKETAGEQAEHLANTISSGKGKGKSCVAADSLSLHIRRVYSHRRGAFDLLHRLRDRFPALDEGQIPADIIYPPREALAPFRWQAQAAYAARSLCASREGGFFACILAGTGTGKTRAAPTILANAAMGDVRPERRYLRFNLALGLRVLAKQSARAYIDDLAFRDEDISVLVGQPPLDFDDLPADASGSESQIQLPEWLQVERVKGRVPDEGDEREADWLRSLSADTDRALPAYCDLILEGTKDGAGRRLIAPPITVGTIDHFMDLAAPLNSRFLLQSIRVLTSDLILDELDQFDAEDMAAIGRLVFQAGAAGRRVIIMSATLTSDVAEAMYFAYQRGWSSFAKAQGLLDHVNLLCTGDAQGSCFTNQDGGDLHSLLAATQQAILHGLQTAPAARRGTILPPCMEWQDLVEQIDQSCTQMHSVHAAQIEGFHVSVGMVRMTRIAHTAALAAQLPSGDVGGQLRVTLCLHSQFPRLHREWIEAQLKRSLTRKGARPDEGLRHLCEARHLFAQARDMGTRQIQIVVITSPVIETGNDLDFDYAILDPISIRSIIQAAGRVRRHRPAEGDAANILILGRSPIAMTSGRLQRPGVETQPHDDTKVPRRSLEDFDKRLFKELAGDETFARINAATLLSQAGRVPLRDQETELRKAMLAHGAYGPLGIYATCLKARFNRGVMTMRKFRRSETRDLLYWLEGEGLEDAQWRLDLAPGRKDSCSISACQNGLTCSKIEGAHLFDQLTELAWADYSRGETVMTSQDLKSLMQVSIPDYMDDTDGSPTLTYTPFTGFTRGRPEDLFNPFGKQTTHQ